MLFSTLIISNPFLQSIAQYGARKAHLFIRVCALITMAYYHSTVQGTNSAPLCSGLRAGSQRCLTIDFRMSPWPPLSLVDGRHPPAPPPRCSRHQAEVCYTARIARAAWHPDEASALISANRSAQGAPERACWADAALVQPLEHGPGVRCKEIHIAVFVVRQFHSSAKSSRM